MTKCIAVLNRGYTDEKDYYNLIKRNIHISNNLKDKSIDILIFHEGNILENHQIFISNKTPELKIKFIDISNIAFQDNKKNIEFDKETNAFNLGYRHMCSFWFINFFDAVKNYDKLLRIDEDCYIDSNIDEIFLKLDKHLFICGSYSRDCNFVTKGLNQHSLEFLNENKEKYTFKNTSPKNPDGPYTNLIGFSLDKINNNDMFHKYKIKTDNSDMIYKQRWGDLPLWGEVIYYIFGIDTIKIDKTIKYFHESHNTYVNYTDRKEK
jgi:hypothetical protein